MYCEDIVKRSCLNICDKCFWNACEVLCDEHLAKTVLALLLISPTVEDKCISMHIFCQFMKGKN